MKYEIHSFLTFGIGLVTIDQIQQVILFIIAIIIALMPVVEKAAKWLRKEPVTLQEWLSALEKAHVSLDDLAKAEQNKRKGENHE